MQPYRCHGAHLLVLAEPGLVSLEIVSPSAASLRCCSTHQDQTAHHVHGGAKGGVENGLVGGDHPLAAGLVVRQHFVLLLRLSS